MKQDMIVILDLGCTENTATARAIRALGVYSEIYPHDITPAELAALPNVRGVILNGGPNRIVDGVSIDVSPEIYTCGLPVLAVCHPAADAHAGCAQVSVRNEPWPQDEDAAKKDLEAFVFGECHAQANWNMENFIADQIDLVRRQVGDKKVLLALSGGVDSSVVAALLLKAVGNQLTCVHVNHGLLRKGEPEQVVEVFRNQMNANLVYVDASERFLTKLAGVADPEQKRKIIGAEFIRVFEEEARKLAGIDFLAQGTIYPDIVESGTKTAKMVKSHHNVGGLPEDLSFELVEPLRQLFKDEVRQLGRELGLPEYLVSRQPFPGPGLAIRIIGDITKEKADTLREADIIFREEIAKAGEDQNLNQYFAVLTNTRSVGVMGDGRTYDYTLALRAVTTSDFMTADWARIPYEVLDKISTRIVNEVRGINRIVYDITSKPPATIEWE